MISHSEQALENDLSNRFTPDNCPSSHGVSGIAEGSTYDETLGIYICICGRTYFSNLPKPDDIKAIRSYEAIERQLDDTTDEQLDIY
jgi:hypothetical protein